MTLTHVVQVRILIGLQMVSLAYSVNVLDCESREQGSIPEVTQKGLIVQWIE